MLGLFTRKPKTDAAPRQVAPSKGGRVVRVVRAGFDSAVTNDHNRRHWANADGLLTFE